MNKLVFKFLLPIIILTTIIFLTSSLIFVSGFKKSSEEMIINSSQEISTMMVKYISNWFDSREDQLKNWSRSKIIQTALSEGFFGKSARQSSITELKTNIQTFKFYNHLNIANLNGDIIVTTINSNKGKNISDLPFFSKALNDAFYKSDVFSNENQKPTIILATPIWVNNEIKGLLFGETDFSQFNASFSETMSKKNSFIYILDLKGRYISHKNKNLILNQETMNNTTVQTIIENRIGVLEYKFENKTRIDVYQHFPYFNWIIGISFDKSEIFSNMLNSIYQSLIIAFILLFFAAFIISLWANSTLIRPIRSLVKAAGDLSQGNLNINIAHTNENSEIGTLAKSFDYMRSNLRKYIKEIENHSQTLEEKVKERTFQLESSNDKLHQMLHDLKKAQQQLVQSEKMASLGILVAGIAHEINNPAHFLSVSCLNLNNDLNSLKTSLAELVEDDKEFHNFLEQRFAKLIETNGIIDEGAKRITAIVTNLRTFSRLDESSKKTVDISETIQSTISIIRPKYSKEIDFKLNLDFSPYVECWPAKLGQVIMNIIINGCQALLSNQGQKNRLISVRTYPDNEFICIALYDNGPGIKPEVIKNIFDPFYTTKDVGEGTGLGLSISTSIIEDHDGHINVESAPNKGTTFTISLPMKKEKNVS